MVYRQKLGNMIDVPQGNFAFLERVPDGVALQYACRHEPQNTVLFSASAGVEQRRPSLA
ncbi:hypothetical protein ACSAMZ_13160 [Xanthomonas citri pv. bilvae]|uniref:hypothetical protein n=1 Tax=Xanthomonas citri TaxID=346 RepID=UPI0030C82715